MTVKMRLSTWSAAVKRFIVLDENTPSVVPRRYSLVSTVRPKNTPLTKRKSALLNCFLFAALSEAARE